MLNYTIRPVLWLHKANKQGLCPLMIAVTISRKVTYFKTPYKLLEGQWDHVAREMIDYPNAKLMNAALRKQIADLEKEIATRQIAGDRVTGHLLKKRDSVKTFEQFALEIRDTRGDRKEINRLLDFHPNLQLTDIDQAFLRKYEQHERKRGMSQNTINTTFKYIRRTLNQAKREGYIKNNPCNDIIMPGYKQPDRVYLVEVERNAMLALLDKDLPESMYNTLCYFLLGVFSGLRHSDWSRFDPVKMVEGGFLRLRAKKNNELVVLPIGPTLQGIIDRIKKLPAPYTMEFCNVQLKAIAPLAGVKKALTTHAGRHSFGYLCASNRLPKSVTAELMGITVKVVDVYYHLAGVDIADQAAILKTI